MWVGLFIAPALRTVEKKTYKIAKEAVIKGRFATQPAKEAIIKSTFPTQPFYFLPIGSLVLNFLRYSTVSTTFTLTGYYPTSAQKLATLERMLSTFLTKKTP